jgi:hypothetical protein
VKWWVLLLHYYSVVKWRHFHASIRGDCTIQELFFSPSSTSENPATSELKKGSHVCPLLENLRWSGKPIVATTHLFNEISLAGLMEIWNEFVHWQKQIMPTLPVEQQQFSVLSHMKNTVKLKDAETFNTLDVIK